MVSDRKIVLAFVFLLEFADVVIDYRGVLAMCHQKQRRCGKELVQRLLIVHKHVACAAAHEHFHSWHPIAVHSHYCVKVVVGGSDEEGIVDAAAVPCQGKLVLKQLNACGLRHGVGHVHV